MRVIYFYTGSINGVDALGHYVRARLRRQRVRRPRADQPAQGCEATFDSTGEAADGEHDRAARLPARPGEDRRSEPGAAAARSRRTPC